MAPRRSPSPAVAAAAAPAGGQQPAYAALAVGAAALLMCRHAEWASALPELGCLAAGVAAWCLRDRAGAALAYTVTHHRWVLACFLMPVSLVFAGFWHVRSRLVFMMGSAPEMHEARVTDVQRQVRGWCDDHADGEKMCTARAGWLAMSLRVGKYKSTHRNIRIELRDGERRPPPHPPNCPAARNINIEARVRGVTWGAAVAVAGGGASVKRGGRWK